MRAAWLMSALAVALLAPAAPGASQRQEQDATTAEHARKVARLLVRHVMVVYGTGKPPFGPVDVLIENGIIAEVRAARGTMPPSVDAVIDGSGRYLLPGFINTHMHWHEDRAPGFVQPIQYERNLYLASGVTTARELGGNFEKTARWRAESAAGTIVAPHILAYVRPIARGVQTPESVRQAVRDAKTRGADGLKLMPADRDLVAAALDEARKVGLPSTAHIGVEETTARDYIELGVSSIEHFYGIADAALGGSQAFPDQMNYDDEVHRFAEAGALYAQADPEKLRSVVRLMAERKVAWSPTLSIYEACRDLLRAQNLPWYREYLHPVLEAFWQPSGDRHGSFFAGWTSTYEARWRRNYSLWMEALREFGREGGLITTGDDAGYMWSLYGFGLIRELELQQEAGFHPLDVIKHATANGAALLGLGNRRGRVRAGYEADLIVVNGNPIEDLRVLNPAGVDRVVGGVPVRAGGIEWTIKAGVPYHGPTLMAEVREMVAQGRRRQKPGTSP